MILSLPYVRDVSFLGIVNSLINLLIFSCNSAELMVGCVE